MGSDVLLDLFEDDLRRLKKSGLEGLEFFYSWAFSVMVIALIISGVVQKIRKKYCKKLSPRRQNLKALQVSLAAIAFIAFV